MSNVSRRSFVKGAGLTGAAVATSAALTGVAVADEATEAEVTSAPDYSSWLPAEPEISDDMVEEEVEADVIVVGVGDSGCCAIRAAAEEGATVLAFEKSETKNTTGQGCAVVGGKVQETWGRGDGFMDKYELAEKHMNECLYHNSLPIFMRWENEMKDVFDWFIAPSNPYIAPESFAEIPEENRSNYIFPFFYPMLESYDWTKEALPTYPTTIGISNLSQMMADTLAEAEATGNVDIRYGHFGTKLIMEDGRCCGVYARNAATGKYVKATAKGGVILTCGDYAHDTAMLKHFVPSVVENEVPVMNPTMDVEGNYTATGDGHKMAAWAGVALQQWHAPMIHHMGGGAGIGGRGVIGNNGYLWLNLAGKRFMNEDLPGQQLENQLEKQPGHMAYQFFDAAWPEQLQYFPAAHGTACYYRDEPLPDYTANGLKISVRCPQDIQDGIDSGQCMTADTIEELLAQLDGIDVETAKASIERYNELCDGGFDLDFGKSAQRLFGLTTPPFYAVRCEEANMLVCLGGIVSDEEARAYDEAGQVVPGLYCAGNMQGSRFAVEYPICLKGVSVSMCIFYGYVAGKNAAAAK